MALMRWRPISEIDPSRNLTRIQDEINRLFDFTMGRPLAERGLFEGEWALDNKGAVYNIDVDVFLGQSRQFSLYDNTVFVFIHINRKEERGREKRAELLSC